MSRSRLFDIKLSIKLPLLIILASILVAIAISVAGYYALHANVLSEKERLLTTQLNARSAQLTTYLIVLNRI